MTISHLSRTARPHDSAPSGRRRPLGQRWALQGATLGLAAVLSLTGCSVLEAVQGNGSSASSQRDVAPGTGVWDASKVHDITVSFDQDEYDAMIATYTNSDEKEWVKADVTIDGTTYSDAGLRLKGNSSLRGVSSDSKAEELPWLIRLDKFVDGQALDGWTEFVVRSNSSTSALNEAVALDLLREAGLASEQAVHSTFSVNGSDATLRLIVQHLDEAWEEENFSTTGLLYKSEADGDWTYRGDDAEKYVDVFDQETGDDDFTPLTEYLDFLNNSSDEEFAEKLGEEMDVDAFATYLAFQDLVDNFDDIDGPGNNSYLRWDAENETFTVVAWDHNLAFGGRPGNGGGMGGGQPGDQPDGQRGGQPDGQRGQMPRFDRSDLPEGMPQMPEGFTPGERPEGMPEPPEGFTPGQGGQMPGGAQNGEQGQRGPGAGQGGMGGGPGGRSNILVERFTAVEEFSAKVTAASERLQKELYDSGRAAELLDARVTALSRAASDLIDADTLTSEADAIRAYFTGERESTGSRRQGEPQAPSQAATTAAPASAA